MPVADFSGWWIVGWAVGFGGAVVAAILLLVAIRLARAILSEAEQISEAIGGAHRNTSSIFDLTRTNLALDRLSRGLRGVRRNDWP